MALHLSPELEQRIALLAKVRQRDPQAVLDDLLATAEEEAAFDAAVDAGAAQIDAGLGIPHDVAMERLLRAASGQRPSSYPKQ